MSDYVLCPRCGVHEIFPEYIQCVECDIRDYPWRDEE